MAAWLASYFSLPCSLLGSSPQRQAQKLPGRASLARVGLAGLAAVSVAAAPAERRDLPGPGLREPERAPEALSSRSLSGLGGLGGEAEASEAQRLARVVEWSRHRLEEAEREFKEQGFSRQASPDEWDNEVIYNVFVDRFANGDIRNDLKNVEQSQKDQLSYKTPFSVYAWRHGGDLQGVRNRLGYLRHLGVTAIWLSPVFECNRGIYAGYCTSDFTRVDPGFGSEKLLRQLVQDAHGYGIRVILDIVVNHVTSVGMHYWTAPKREKVRQCVKAAEFSYWNQNRSETFSAGSGMVFGPEVPEYLRFESFFTRCGSKDHLKDPTSNDRNVSESEFKKDYEAYQLWPEYFQDDFFELNTMDAHFTELFVNILNYWIAAADVDGFRVDAVAHVTADFSAYLSTHARHYAAKLGKSNFYVMGEFLIPELLSYPELYLGNVSAAAPQPLKLSEALQELQPLLAELREPVAGLSAIYPSPELSYVRDIAAGNATAAAWFGPDFAHGREWFRGVLSRQAKPGAGWAMVENHDVGRLLAQQAGTIAWDHWRLLAALGWSFTDYAMPTLLYGAELAFNGQCLAPPDGLNERQAVLAPDIPLGSMPADQILMKCKPSAPPDEQDDGFKRQDMFEGGPLLLGSAVPSVQAKARISGDMMTAWGPHWCEEGLLDRSNIVFRTVRALSRIRRACPALRSVHMLDAKTGHEEQLAYWKMAEPLAGSTSPMLVLLTFTDTPGWAVTRVSAPVGADFELISGQVFVDLLNPKRTAVVGADGVLEVSEADEVSNVAIFALEHETVVDGDSDGHSDWLLCAGHELPALTSAPECRDEHGQLFTWLALAAWGVLSLGAIAWNARSGIYLCLVKKPSAPQTPAKPLQLPPEVHEAWPKHVFIAAIEHTIPERNVKVSAGGLGKVLDQMLKEHPPGHLSLVHPRVGGVQYGDTDYYTKISVVVDGQKQDVEVHMIEGSGGDVTRTWYLLDHPWFSALTREAPYPYPMTKLSVLRFFSLWNQAAAALMVLLEPDVYHCMDYHAAMVPLYVAQDKQIPTIIVLHNADYDGAVETDFINDVAWRTVAAHRRLSLIFNLEMDSIRKYATFEGRFNMLSAGIACIRELQKGYGVCTVSGMYADELKRERTMFKALPLVLPIDNAIDSAGGAQPTVEELQLARTFSKRRLQEFCSLNVDPDAKILIFLGRWVKQKGVDHIALLAPQILSSNPSVQFVLAGPAGDPYGSYAQEMLIPLMAEFPGRLFIATTFFSLPKEVRAGAHFCLMPSVSEPFGYVDVEFGLLGVPSLGCAIGGLGKMPGVYFRQQNSDSSEMLLAGFYAAVEHALTMPDEDYWSMAVAGMGAEFPFSVWRANLHECYRTALTHFQPEIPRVSLASQTSQVSFEVLEERRLNRWRLPVMSGGRVANQIQRMDVNDAGEFLAQPVSEERVREIMRDWMADSKGQATDAETLQSYIALAAQRLKEKNCITRWLMRPSHLFSCLLGSRCLRIHVFIALGYILSPQTGVILEVEKLNWLPGGRELSFGFTLQSWLLQGLGLATGSLVWLYLSRQVPANLLMSGSLFLNLIYYFALQTLVGTGSAWVQVCNFCGGLLGSARLLFLVWNFSEDFHGGFQVAARRVAVVETARTAVAFGLEAVTTRVPGAGLGQTWLYVLSSFVLGFLVALAPSCYSTHVLPDTNFCRDLRQHRVYLLLTASLALDALSSYASSHVVLWLKLDGWLSDEISNVLFCAAAATVVLLVAVFTCLHKLSVWGPWAMRDFTCLIPPGGLLRTIAFADLGHLHHRSGLFVTAVVISCVVDVARYSALWTAILSTLSNKWYALKGGFLAMTVISVCTAVSPFVVDALGRALVGVSPVYDSFQVDYPQVERLALERAVLWSVWPLAGAAYLLQLLALSRFTFEVLTYKGHGHRVPGHASAGACGPCGPCGPCGGGEGFSTLRVSSRRVVRRMRQGGQAKAYKHAGSGDHLV